jgi:hypothetical protein
MARIRSIKPEFFTSETLQRVEKCTRLTFIGLWTYVDDNGVGIDNPRLITAALFPLEEDFAAELASVGEDLIDLAREGVIQRYTVEGRALFFITNWDEHQKISHPAKPRYFRPSPGPGNPPGKHPEVSHVPLPTLRRNSGAPPETLPGPENRPISDERLNFQSNNAAEDPELTDPEETADQTPLWQASGNPRENLRQPSALSREQGAGSRVVGNREQGIPPPAGGEPPAAGRALELVRPAAAVVISEPRTTDELIADWINHVPKRPPGSVIGRVGKTIKQLLEENVDPADIRAGVAAWARKGADPSSLPSFVNQAMNAAGRTAGGTPADEFGGDAHLNRYLARAAARNAASA